MKRWFGLFLGVGILCAAASVTVYAEGETTGEPKAAEAVAEKPVLSPEDQAKKQVINDLGVMQNQEVRVIVLQQVLSREVAELRQSQAVFCDAYKLDVEKWRKGLYRYDEKQAKFVEVPETPPAQ